MNKLEDICPPSTALSVAWEPFTRKLAAVLAELLEDQCLILSDKHSRRLVQFAAQGSHGMRIETLSNIYLSDGQQLNEQQIATLTNAGWRHPTKGANSCPDTDPDGSPNFFTEFTQPVCFETVASMAVCTLSEILRVAHPARLQYFAFDIANGEVILLPELGLKHADRTAQGDITIRLREVIRKASNIADLEYDKDGDLCVRLGSGLTIVRLIQNPLYVRLYSILLKDVKESHEVLTRLNSLNIGDTLMRFFFMEESIYCVSDIPADPMLDAHVTKAFESFCQIADSMGTLLQTEFGGRTAFAKVMPSVAIN